jgi:hypothetical protein
VERKDKGEGEGWTERQIAGWRDEGGEGGSGEGGHPHVASKVGDARLAGRSGGAARGCGIVYWPRLPLFLCQVSMYEY